MAAGSSSRLGQPKQLLPFQGYTLVEYSFQTAQNLSDNCFVVIGANIKEIQSQVNIASKHVFQHLNWKDGMGSSIAFGLQNILTNQPDLENILLLLCDQPFITPKLLLELKDSHFNSNKSITASSYGDSFGVPAIFSRKHFEELLELVGNKGAKKIISGHKEQTQFVKFPKGNIDIDTIDDLGYLT